MVDGKNTEKMCSVPHESLLKANLKEKKHQKTKINIGPLMANDLSAEGQVHITILCGQCAGK